MSYRKLSRVLFKPPGPAPLVPALGLPMCIIGSSPSFPPPAFSRSSHPSPWLSCHCLSVVAHFHSRSFASAFLSPLRCGGSVSPSSVQSAHLSLQRHPTLTFYTVHTPSFAFYRIPSGRWISILPDHQCNYFPAGMSGIAAAETRQEHTVRVRWGASGMFPSPVPT